MNLVKDFLELKFANKIAIIDDDKELSYKSFQDQIKLSAGYLHKNGLTSGDRYIIMMNDCVDWLSAFFGGLYLGAVPVLLPTTASSERCRHVIGASQPKFILYNDTANQIIPFLPCGKILYHLPAPTEIITLPNLHLYQDNEPSLWLSSSGTGGKLPKLVVHRHQSVKEAVRLNTEFYSPDPNNILFSTSKLSFQYGLFATLYGLFQGGTVILTAKVPSGKLVCDFASRYKVTQLFSTPSVLLSLSKINDRREDLSTVNLIVSAGEVLNEHVEKRILDTYGKIIYNSLGMSEVIICVIGRRLNIDQFQTVGKPFADVEIKILDNDQKPVDIGVVGELYVKTPTMAMYYHDEPEATATAFQNSWYKTNDLVNQDNNGMVTYVGRKNDCVKINGQFVSPSVVENELLKYSGIDDCMVAAVMFEDKLVLAANIVMEVGIPEPSLGSIRNFLRDCLEPHMIPKIIKFTNEIPKTTTAKKIRAKILV